MAKVWITGIGIVSPIGIGRQAFWENALRGKPGVRALDFAGAEGLPSRVAGLVPDFAPDALLPDVKWKRLSRLAQFALAAALLARDDAGLGPDDVPPERSGVAVGVGMVGMDMVEEAVEACRLHGPSRVKPYSAAGSYAGSPAGNISVELRLQGESMTVSTGCSAGTNAIGYAFRSIRAGDHDLMLAGGAEACLTPSTLASLGNAGVLSRHNEAPPAASRPFDGGRDGYVLGEGAAILVLESDERVRRRGGRPYAEIAGYGSTSDAHSMHAVEPEGRQADRAVEQAFRGTGLASGDVGYVSAHGSSSVASDRRETKVLHRILGDRAARTHVSSVKSMIGHPLGACGGFQTAVCALALSGGGVPPTINYEVPDPECDLDYVPNQAREVRVRAAFNLALGMGGNNAALALKAV
jgi:3-oxoacyl-[acyl-carrier-protein] synthase II